MASRLSIQTRIFEGDLQSLFRLSSKNADAWPNGIGKHEKLFYPALLLSAISQIRVREVERSDG